MCGIFGVVGTEPVDGPRFRAALGTIRRRGPDDTGVAFFGPDGRRLTTVEAPPDARAGVLGGDLGSGWTAALGHQRLSIIDLSPTGHQPMALAGGRKWMVYNGELYNFVELRSELESMGRRFTTASDSEVVLQAYDAWGPACFDRFVGMWALAIVDLDEGTLTLSRDAFGIKPLYYTSGAAQLVFASDPRPILAYRGSASRRVDAAVARCYLESGTMPDDSRSFFADVRQVPSGVTLEIPLQRPDRHRERATRRGLPAVDEGLSASSAAEQLRELFLDSVRLHLRSDVPVGAALSGGIDSSGIVAAMRHLAGADLDLRTFSYAADRESIDESSYQSLVATATGAHHHVVRIATGDFARDLDDVIGSQCEPFRGPSVYAQYRVFELARRSGVIVMLDGQGADEQLGGYIPFVALRVAALMRRGRLLEASRLLARSRKVTITPGARRPLELYVANRLVPAGLEQRARRRRHGLADAPWFIAGPSTEVATPRRPLREGLRGEAALQTWTTSLPELLRYEDRNSMAHSLESRVPFLTMRMASFAMSLPDRLLVDDLGRTKAVLRDALAGLVPRDVLDRREKIGFQPPDDLWLAACEGWVDTTLAEATSSGLPIDVRALTDTIASRRRAGRPALDGHLFRAACIVRWATINGIA